MDTVTEQPPEPGGPATPNTYAGLIRIATWATVLTGVPIFLIGAIDFLGGRAIDARILGSLNLVAGGVLLATAAGFRYRTVVTLGLAVAGGLLAMAFGIYYGWQWWRFGQMDLGLLLLAAWMLILSAIILTVLQGTWHRYEITEHTKRRFGAGRFGIPVLAVLGTLGALFQFWYGAAYGPSALPPNLVVATKLTPVGEQTVSGARAYSVDVDVSNVGQSRVQVLASWYNLATVIASPAASEVPYQQVVNESFTQDPHVLAEQPHRAGRLMTMSGLRPVGAGELLSRGWYFEPGETSHVQFLTYVDPLDGDLLQLGVGLEIARGNRLEQAPKPSSFECASDLAPIDLMAWTSSEPSTIRSMTTPAVEMVYGWQTNEDGVLGLSVCYGVNGTWHSDAAPDAADDPILDVVMQEYGIAVTFAETQLSLWPAPVPATP